MGDTAGRMADEIVVGRVEGGRVAAATLEVGAQRIERAQGDEISVRAGGYLVRVRLAASVIVGEVVDGAWGEVARHRLAALFADAAPGDHVHVRISGAALGTGDVVALRVQRNADSFTALRAACGTDERSAMAALTHAEASANAHVAEADRVAAAAAAREERLRVTPHPPWSRLTILLALAAPSVAGLAALEASGWHVAIPQGREAAGTWALAAGLGGAAMIAWSTRHELPLLHQVGVKRPDATRQLLFLLQILVSLIAMAMASGRSRPGATNHLPAAGLIVACFVPAVAALIGALRGFASVRGIWPVERAAKVTPPPPPRTWGVIDGVVAGSGDPVLTATTTRTARLVGSGRGGWSWDEVAVATTAAPVFRVEASGWHADVHTGGLMWAAPPIWQPRGDRRVIHAIAAIRPGDRVRVLARTGDAGDTSLRASGPESLFVIAGSPSAFLRRALRPPLVIAAYVALVVASALAS